MATATANYGYTVGKYFTEQILPYLEIRGSRHIADERNQFIADMSTNPELVKVIEDHYGVSIW